MIQVKRREIKAGHRHVARLLDDGYWSACWWPDEKLTKDEAITAMALAELVSDQGNLLGAQIEDVELIEEYAAELRLDPVQAVYHAASRHEERPRRVTPPSVRTVALLVIVAVLTLLIIYWENPI